MLSVIVQHGGARASQLFGVLCRNGPFQTVDGETFAQLLRQLGAEGVLQQSTDGTLLLGAAGERIVGHYSFYAAFHSDEEYRLIHAGRALGTLPLEYSVLPGMHLVFAGKRWRVLDVDMAAHRITVEPSLAGKAPTFGGGGRLLHRAVVEAMREVYVVERVPRYLESSASELLREGQRQFTDLGLATEWAVPLGAQTMLFPWIGGRALNALGLALSGQGLEIEPGDIHLVANAARADVVDCVKALATKPAPDALHLVEGGARETEKYHALLDAPLLSADYASARLDVEGAWGWVRTRLET